MLHASGGDVKVGRRVVGCNWSSHEELVQTLGSLLGGLRADLGICKLKREGFGRGRSLCMGSMHNVIGRVWGVWRMQSRGLGSRLGGERKGLGQRKKKGCCWTDQQEMGLGCSNWACKKVKMGLQKGLTLGLNLSLKRHGPRAQ